LKLFFFIEINRNELQVAILKALKKSRKKIPKKNIFLKKAPCKFNSLGIFQNWF